MQCRPFGWMGERITDWACAACKASSGAAFPPRFALQPGTATAGVEGAAGKRIDRARAEARARYTPVAGPLASRAPWQGDAVPEADGATAGIPKPEIRVHKHTEGRRPDRIRTAGPAKERPIRRSLIRKEGEALELRRRGPDDPAAPAVKGIRPAVVALRGFPEMVPGFRIRRGGQYQGADTGRGRFIRPNCQSARPETVRREQRAGPLEAPGHYRKRFRKGRDRDQPSCVGRAS